MERTQIYLTKEQKEKLSNLAKTRSTTLAHIIREAISSYINDTKKNIKNNILDAHGMWKNRDDIPDSVTYVNSIRSAINRRLEDK